jgi:hypothetical protein
MIFFLKYASSVVFSNIALTLLSLSSLHRFYIHLSLDFLSEIPYISSCATSNLSDKAVSVQPFPLFSDAQIRNRVVKRRVRNRRSK